MTATLLLLRAEAIAARLRELGIVSAQQLEQLRPDLASAQERVGAILMRHGVLRDADAVKRLAGLLGAIAQPLEAVQPPPALVRCLPSAVWTTHRLVPVREEDGTLLLATDDPLAVFVLEPLSRRYGVRLEAILIAEEPMAALLAGLAAAAQPLPAAGHVTAAAAARSAVAPPAAPVPPRSAPAAARPAAAAAASPAAPRSAADDEPIIRLVDSMLSEAVRMRASDIHIQPGAEAVQIRYRIDGVLRHVNATPPALHGSIVSRIKIMAGMNIAEKRLPQDGRLQLAVEHRPLDVRISTLPSTHGESVVMRLLDRSQPIRGLADMGLSAENQQTWERLIRRPHGMVLVTGPTGAGKTTTLYGAMAMLNQPDRKLITVEDPVEYQLSGVNQVAVKTTIGLTFAAALRSMLRQAPDVIMVGEIRDQETPQVGEQAALTAHQVHSTLHTNDAPTAVTRLIDMGVAPFLVASTVQGVLAQRLVRRICVSCRMTDNATEEERKFLGVSEPLQLVHGVGCEACHGSGFLGRVGLFELLVMAPPIRTLVVERATASAIRQAAARAGMRALREDGCAKIREGITTMSEVLRVVATADE
ncbi:MAG: Flp pilus assembly complex ATPase component TadA [Candidatus Omnitrophica bacterium]|nr:Flp pilus assembly complex ATPase component TadA [Candidatus Omnitrophota bacterium]